MTTPRRRWTFGLRTLFLAVLASCVVFATIKQRLDRSRLRCTAADSLAAAGGFIEYNLFQTPRDKRSWLERWLDDDEADLVHFPAGFPQDEAKRITDLFREAAAEWEEPLPDDSPASQADRP